MEEKLEKEWCREKVVLILGKKKMGFLVLFLSSFLKYLLVIGIECFVVNEIY